MANSIKPFQITESEEIRIDEGVDWFHNLTWSNASVPVDLAKWELKAELYNAFDAVLIPADKFVVTPSTSETGKAEFRIAAADAEIADTAGGGFSSSRNANGAVSSVLRIIATNITADLEYQPGESIKVASATIPFYRRSSRQ